MSAALREDLPGEAALASGEDLPLGYDGMMTAEAFSQWPGDGVHWRFALIDGLPTAMSPPSYRHGLIHGRLSRLLGTYLVTSRPECEAVIGVGVQPRAGAKINVRVPDLTVACGRQTDVYARDPILIVEILSPSNERETREAVRACLSIPSIAEVLILDSLQIRAEVLTRQADGSWPRDPVLLGSDAELSLASLGFPCEMQQLYPA